MRSFMKNIRENMYVRFGYETFVGLIGFISLLIFGEKGMSVMALIAFLPLIHWKKHFDEREYQLFYKAGNYTFVTVYLGMLLIYFLFPSMNFICALALVSLFFHGLCGLIVFLTG